MACCIAVGILNGELVARQIAPFVATLGTQTICGASPDGEQHEHGLHRRQRLLAAAKTLQDMFYYRKIAGICNTFGSLCCCGWSNFLLACTRTGGTSTPGLQRRASKLSGERVPHHRQAYLVSCFCAITGTCGPVHTAP